MIFIREIPLPYGVRGFTAPDIDNNYNVYINQKLSDDQKRRTLDHEMEHIKNEDCYSDEDIAFIENRISCK